MSFTLVLANKAYSSWSLRPFILMRHFAIPFDEIVIGLGQETTRTDILNYSPSARCPALLDGDLTVWDSLAIIEYLAEQFPDLPIWPREKAARAVARSLSAEMHSGFQALRTHLPMNMRRAAKRRDLTPEVVADVVRIEAAWSDARERFGTGGDFLFGGFCAADAMFAPVVNRLHVYDVPVSAESRAYMDLVMALPAYQDWQKGAAAESWRIAKYEVA
ncbi:glutathione S-transferase family protein [uncultured Methylovirgula sp.]|uniref:glutathione S-transferase family protein n=1 Tax=uncultured Methylovirgula sp. TaxID=1285960 RepID=UPI0026219E46|nr:glutathione S-transferase family protein [uncultured Methylovirgula sp.]